MTPQERNTIREAYEARLAKVEHTPECLLDAFRQGVRRGDSMCTCDHAERLKQATVEFMEEREKIATTLGRIYFDIAASAIGEGEVRHRRDAALAALRGEEP